MWIDLPKEEREKYKDYIRGFVSCSEAFSQKNLDTFSPVIISKYQEAVFQKSFCCKSEDIHNTSFDTAKIIEKDGKVKKCLIEIKTFGIHNNMQKIAQFESELKGWQNLLSLIRSNVKPNMS